VFGFIRLYFSACWEFIKTLIKARDPVVGKSELGYDLLKGWTHSPEEKIVKKFEESKNFKTNQRPIMWFYCIKGPHTGEIIPLKNRVETLGASVHNSVVITPKGMANNSTYKVVLDGVTKIDTQQGASFKINGREETSTTLIDFDVLEIFGNEFIVFENIAY
jgi:hypothetical protein